MLETLNFASFRDTLVDTARARTLVIATHPAFSAVCTGDRNPFPGRYALCISYRSDERLAVLQRHHWIEVWSMVDLIHHPYLYFRRICGGSFSLKITVTSRFCTFSDRAPIFRPALCRKERIRREQKGAQVHMEANPQRFGQTHLFFDVTGIFLFLMRPAARTGVSQRLRAGNLYHRGIHCKLAAVTVVGESRQA